MTEKQHSAVVREMSARCRVKGAFPHASFTVSGFTLSDTFGGKSDWSQAIPFAGATAGFREVARISRTIAATRKAFNPKIGKIKTENILILQKA